ncbi:DUF2484 family protein [Marivita sp. S2033]|uniref:DUF2484 family protein n=1 Tax=Marivita sp. S2033 TaxID=3373187 RepID=UPI003982C378
MTLLLMCLGWVFASALVAMLPMRWQYVPGVSLLLAAPFLIFEIAQVAGLLASALGVMAFVSMYRNPLRYFWKRASGQRVEVPQ